MDHFYQNLGENWFTYPDFYSQMVSYFVDGSHFVEVGSWKGRSSSYMAVEIINSKKKIRFDCVDTWDGSDEHIDPNSYAFNPKILEDPNWLYEEFLKNVSPVQEIINPVRKKSNLASFDYDDRSLDFVFIDAGHSYENVKEDITSWFPKIKIGGFIAGHDYSPKWPSVVQAVDEFLSLPIFTPNQVNIYENQFVWCLRK
jgi:hypothetical protein